MFKKLLFILSLSLTVVSHCYSESKNTRESSAEPSPTVEFPFNGWGFHHPDGKIGFYFELSQLKALLEALENLPFDLQKFSGLAYKGSFFLKMDPSVSLEKPLSENLLAHEKFMEEILEGIFELEPDQEFSDDFTYYEEYGFLTWIGAPYFILVGAQDGFLYGLAAEIDQLDQTDFPKLLIKFRLENLK